MRARDGGVEIVGRYGSETGSVKEGTERKKIDDWYWCHPHPELQR